MYRPSVIFIFIEKDENKNGHTTLRQKIEDPIVGKT